MANIPEIPSRIKAVIGGSKINYSTNDFIDMMTGSFNRNGYPNVKKADLKIQLWNILNDKPLDEVGSILRKYVALDGE